MRHMLTQEREQQQGVEKAVKSQKKKEEDRKRIREEKARLARLTAIQVCLLFNMRIPIYESHFGGLDKGCFGGVVR